MDRIPERLRVAAAGVEKATGMMAAAKSERNRAAGDTDACYEGLPKESTAEWQAAAMIEKYETALRNIAQRANEYGPGEMAAVDCIHAMHGIARDALDGPIKF